MRHKLFAGLPQYAVLLAILFVFSPSPAKAESRLVERKEQSLRPDSRSRPDQMKTPLANYQQGEIYYNGKWIPCSEYDKIVASQGAGGAKPKSVKDPVKARAVARQDSDRRKTLRQTTYATGAAFLGVMLVLGLRGKIRHMFQLSLLPLVLIFGWFTYEERGIDWMSRFPEKITEIPQRLGFSEWTGPSAPAKTSHPQRQSGPMESQSRLNFRRSSLGSDYEPVDLTLGKRRGKSASDVPLQTSAEE